MNKTYEDIAQFLRFIRAHIVQLVAIVLVVVGSFLAIAKIAIPTKFKAYTIVTIPTRYFQQPAVEDIIPAVQDPAEMKTLRESLVTSALSRSFLEKVRADYNLFAAADVDAKKYEANMQNLKAQFEVISLDLTSFQVGFIGATAQTSFDIANLTQTEIVNHLSQERTRKLTDLRNNLLAKVDSLGFNINRAGDPLSTSRPEALQGELQQIRGIINSLGSRYTPEHPIMQRYKAREKLINTWLASHKIPTHLAAVSPQMAAQNASAADTQMRKDVQGLSSSRVLDSERYADLLKRVDILNIVIDYENSDSKNLVVIRQEPVMPLQPISPRMKLAFFWGLLTSLLVCVIYLAVKNYQEMLAASKNKMSGRLNVDFVEEDTTGSTDSTNISRHQDLT